MGKMTFVFEFEDGKEPPVGFGMEFHGGRIVSAAFYDYRDDFFTESERDVLAESMDSSDICERLDEVEVTLASIAKKIELLTI